MNVKSYGLNGIKKITFEWIEHIKAIPAKAKRAVFWWITVPECISGAYKGKFLKFQNIIVI